MQVNAKLHRIVVNYACICMVSTFFGIIGAHLFPWKGWKLITGYLSETAQLICLCQWYVQDANECWTQIVRMLQQKLPAIKPEENGDHVGASAATAGAGAAKGFIDQYFGEWT